MYFDWSGRPHVRVPWPIVIVILIVQATVWAVAWTIRILVYLYLGTRWAVRRLRVWRQTRRADRQELRVDL